MNSNDNTITINMRNAFKKYSPTQAGYYNTSAYGDLRFSNSKKAKYIRVGCNTKATDIIQYLYSNEGFNLKKPKLIISIAGGAKKLNMPPAWKKLFKSGLIKAAKTTSAWIITGGLNVGAMRLVGDAISEEINTESITVLGIATWGTIAQKNLLERSDSDGCKYNQNVTKYCPSNADKIGDIGETFLNQNHTNFLLCDDYTSHDFGREIPFRVNLESELTKGKSLKDYQSYAGKVRRKIPLILVVVRGGFNTLELIYLHQKRVPMLLMEGTKGCADLIDSALKLPSEEHQNEAKIGELIDSSKILEYWMSKPSYQSKRNKAVTYLIEILKTSINYFTPCRLTRESDLQAGFLEALFKDDGSLVQTFKLELLWNKYQISRTESLQERFEALKVKDLEDLLEMALLENNFSFVNALLEKGINLDNFLTLERFDKLYNSRKGSKNLEPFSLYMQKALIGFDENSPINSELIKRFFKKQVFDQFDPYFLPENYSKENSKTYVKYAEENLLIWCVLFNEVEIAKLFWSISEYQIAYALLATRILRIFAHTLPDLQKELIHSSNEFESLAIGVMNVFDNNTRDSMNGILMQTMVPFMNRDILYFAVHCECKNFIALPSIQNVITELWYCKLIHKAGSSFQLKFALCLFSVGLLAPFLIMKTEKVEIKAPKQLPNLQILNFENTKELKVNSDIKPRLDTSSGCSDNEELDDEKSLNGARENDTFLNGSIPFDFESNNDVNTDKSAMTFSNYWSHYVEFFNTPIVLFVYNSVAFGLFLLIFSITMLSKFHYYDENELYYNNTHQNNMTGFNYSSTRSANDIFDNITNKLVILSPFEILLCVWIFALFVEEFNQFRSNKHNDIRTYKQNWLHYFDDEWNILDSLGCMTFLIGYALRIASLWINKYIFTLARIILSLDLSIWFIRSLYFCLAFRAAGPKLLMIKKMINDLKFFLIIITIFMFAFSISVHSILYPQKEFNFDTIMKVLHMGYWTIYGEIYILDDLNRKSCEESPENCPEVTGTFVSSLILMAYMIISAVLLINMIIAMFNSTYESVEENSDIHWKFQRYQLLSESKNFCYFPPPLNLFYYVFVKPSINLIKTLNRKDVVKSQIDSNVRSEMIDEQKCAQTYLREVKTMSRNTIESRLDVQYERLKLYEQKFNDLCNQRVELFQKIDDIEDSYKNVQQRLNNNEKLLCEISSNQKRLEKILVDVLQQLMQTNKNDSCDETKS